MRVQTQSLLSFLWTVIRPYRWHYGMMLSIPIFAAFYDFSVQYALKLLVDAFSAAVMPSYTQLMWPIGLFVGANILLDVAWRAGDIAEWRSEPYVRRTILLKTYDYIQYHTYPFFQNTHAGAITSKIKGILDGYDNFWGSVHHDFTPKLANVVVLTLVLAVVNVPICIFMTVWGTSTVFLMNHLSKKLNILSFDYANHRHAIFGQIADNIANIFTLFSFSSRQKELNRLDKKITKDFIPSNIRMYKYAFALQLFGAFLYSSMLLSLFFFMIHLRQTGVVSTGDFIFVMGISLKINVELWQVTQKMQDFMQNWGDFKSAFTLLQIPQDRAVEDQLPAISIVNPSLEFDKICFAYDPKQPVFNKLSFSINGGEKIGIVGASGAGKSTLVSLLLKYFMPTSGAILIDGKNISECSSDSIRANIALIPQDIMLFHRSILDNIRYGRLEADEQAVMEAARLANIHDFIMGLLEQYHTLVGERGIKLSGGQRQRIAIARAILKNAPLLILDEATSSLDAETEQLIQTSLNVLLEKKNTTVLAIAHRLSTLKHMDRIIVLDKGKIIEEGKHEVLISQDSLYRKLWEMQKI